METRIIAGRRATNRPGVADYLNRSRQTIDLLASRREQTGFPEPIDRTSTGQRGRPQEWYALDDLDAFWASYLQPVETAGKARVHSTRLPGDPDELLSGKQFAALLHVNHDTFRGWISKSRPDWAAGRDGYLPRPDLQEPYGQQGKTRQFWARATAQRFIAGRPGKVPSPGRPPARSG